VRFEVFTAASIKMTAFWVVGGIYTIMMANIKAEITSEASINFYQTTRRNIPEDNHLHPDEH
jgi:hypothetical protein